MGEAEKSIAIKRRIVAPKADDREDSPSEVYTPKRKKSTTGPEASPPPYIPSRKESSTATSRSRTSSGSTTATRTAVISKSQRDVDHQDHRRIEREHSDRRSQHARQTLSSQDRRDLISRSRRMELFKSIGIDRKEGPVIGSSSSISSGNVRRSPRRLEDRHKVADSGDQRVKLSGVSTREVSSRRNNSLDDDSVKDLKIKARLGPVVIRSSDDVRNKLDGKERNIQGGGGLDLRHKMARSTYSKDDMLKIVVNPTAYPALKGSVASRLGKIVVKRGDDSDSDKQDEEDDNGGGGGGGGDNQNKDKRLLKLRSDDNKDRLEKKGGSIGRMAVSGLAKSIVNKQCREAVLSVNRTAKKEFGRNRGRNSSESEIPDSRQVEAADEEDEEEVVEIEDEEERTDIVPKRKTLSVTVKQAVADKSKESTIAADEDEEDNDDSQSGKDNSSNNEEDLADMIGEKLEPELLDDTVRDELNLDLEAEEDIETMIGVKSEEDKPKLGTRFIVTLDGVDERQLCSEDESVGNAGKDLKASPGSGFTPQQQQPIAVQPMPKFPPSAPPPTYVPQLLSPPHHPPLGPSHHHSGIFPPNISPILAPPMPRSYNVRESHTFPPPTIPPPTTLIQSGEHPVNKSLPPPKIQPFSISLKDSDDEFEDKELRMQASSSASGSYISQSGLQSPNESTSLTSLTALQKAKSLERCKFWPACAAGSECEFHHPTSYCKTFPNCKFADKCLFIHPNCKFDSKCTRQDCPFTHTSRRSGLSSAPAAPTIPFHHPKQLPAPSTTTATVCRFFPNCHNPACHFLHPKPCRFGPACQNPNCPFYHPTPAVVVPTQDKLKWKAQSSMAPAMTWQAKEMASSSSSSSSTLTSFSSTASHATVSADPAAKFRQPVAKVSPMSAASTNVSSNNR